MTFLSQFIIFMIMEHPKYIVDSLTKIYNQLYFKNRVEFTIKLEKHTLDPNGTTVVVETYVTVDQAKYWSDSPEFDKDYYEFVNQLHDTAEEELDEVVKYVISDRLVFNRIFYKHINKDIYLPIVDEISEMGYDNGLSYDKRVAYGIITVFNIPNNELIKIERKLDNKFNVDDILITNKSFQN